MTESIDKNIKLLEEIPYEELKFDKLFDVSYEIIN